MTAEVCGRLGRRVASMALAMLGTLCVPGFSAATIDTDVNRFSMTTDDLLQLTVTVTMSPGDKSTDPALAQSGDFEVVGPPRSETGYSFVNMKGSKYIRRIWALRPKGTGSLTVPIATVRVAKQTLRSEALEVQVTQGEPPQSTQTPGPSQSAATSSQPNSGGLPFSGEPNFAVVARTDTTSAYVNEQVTVEFDYYTAYRLPRRPGEQAPKAEGFVAEALPDPEPGYVSVNRREYLRFTRRWALFATGPGKHHVSSAGEEMMIPPNYTTQVFESNVLDIDVKPLPPAPPGAKFSGAVGKFTVQITGAKSEVKAGEGVTVRTAVDGVGNLQAVAAPDLGAPDWCKVYESGEKRTSGPRTQGDRVVLGGKAEFEFLVVPRREGVLELKGASLLYFDPKSGRYETARSAPLHIKVGHGEVLEDSGIQPEDAALNHIHTRKPRLFARRPMIQTPAPCALPAACALALLIAGGVRLSRDRRLADPDRARASRASRLALQAISRAEKIGESGRCDAIADAVAQYVCDRLSLPAAVMGAEDVAEMLQAHGYSPQIVEMAREVLNSCNAGRYAPGVLSAGAQDLPERARELIGALEGGQG